MAEEDGGTPAASASDANGGATEAAAAAATSESQQPGGVTAPDGGGQQTSVEDGETFDFGPYGKMSITSAVDKIREMQADYTRKTQTLAEERKKFEEERQGGATQANPPVNAGEPKAPEQQPFAKTDYDKLLESVDKGDYLYPALESMARAGKAHESVIETVMTENAGLKQVIENISGVVWELGIDRQLAAAKAEYADKGITIDEKAVHEFLKSNPTAYSSTLVREVVDKINQSALLEAAHKAGQQQALAAAEKKKAMSVPKAAGMGHSPEVKDTRDLKDKLREAAEGVARRWNLNPSQSVPIDTEMPFTPR